VEDQAPVVPTLDNLTDWHDITAAPEVVFHWKWLSALVAVPIAAWWYVFLVVVPKQFKEYVESARGYYPKRE